MKLFGATASLLVAVLATSSAASAASAPAATPSCVDMSSGIPFDLEDIVTRVMGAVDKSGLLGLLPSMIKGMGMDPLFLPVNVTMQVPLFNMNVTKFHFYNVSISGWSKINSLGGFSTSHDDPNHVVVQPAIVLGNPGPIWLNASVSVEGELLPRASRHQRCARHQPQLVLPRL